MISAQELRIGNWVYFSYIHTKKVKTRPCRVLEIDNIGSLVKDGGVDLHLQFHSDSIQPLPLSAEILLKVGFRQAGTHFILSIGDVKAKFRFFDQKVYAELGDIYLGDHISYVHQLQNLYFSLTGTELDIKF
jgi:hypothetical protein